MTYYGDGHGAVTDLEQNRLDVMPSATLDPPDAQQLQRASGVRVFQSPAIGLEYWVFNLAPRRHLARAQGGRAEPRHPHRAGVGDRPHEARPGLAARLRRRPATRSSRAATGASRSTSPTTPCSATTTTRRARAASSSRPAGSSAPTASGARTACAPQFELAYAGESSEKRAVTLIRAWARDVGIAIDVRIYDTDKLINLEFNKDGERAAARLRHASCGRSAATRRPSSCSRCSRRPRSASGTTRASPTRATRSSTSRSCSATDDAARVSAIHQLQRIATHGAAVHPALRGRRHQRRQHAHVVELDDAALAGRPADHVVRLRHDHRAAARASSRRRAIRACPGRSPGSAPWPRSALGSSYLARRREQREPIEIADAAA